MWRVLTMAVRVYGVFGGQAMLHWLCDMQWQWLEQLHELCVRVGYFGLWLGGEFMLSMFVWRVQLWRIGVCNVRLVRLCAVCMSVSVSVCGCAVGVGGDWCADVCV